MGIRKHGKVSFLHLGPTSTSASLHVFHKPGRALSRACSTIILVLPAMGQAYSKDCGVAGIPTVQEAPMFQLYETACVVGRSLVRRPECNAGLFVP